MSWKAACAVTDVESQSFKLFDVEGVPILSSRIWMVNGVPIHLCVHTWRSR